MAKEKCARASSSRSRATPEPEPEPEPIAVEFDQNRYRNREAADRFSAQLSSPLTPGLRLDTPFLFNIGVLRCLQDCYLDRLTDRNTILYYPDAIRLFYANLTWNISSESCTLTSYVFGRRISFSQSRLATLLDLPDSGFSFSLDMIPVAGQSHWFDRPFSIEEQLRHTLHCRQVRVASKPSLRDLPPLSRLFHHIIAHNVIPRTDGLSLVSYLDVQLLTFFRSGTPLNLPRLIMLNMIRSASHPALAIPYGLLLTHILAAFDIPLLGEYIEVTRHIVLDCSTLRRKGLLDDRNRLLPEPELENVIVDDDDDDDDEADDDGDDDDADGDDDAADADDDAGGDAGDGFDRDPPPLIIPSTHEAGTSSGPSTSGYEAILTRLDMMQQHMHTGFSRMDLAHSQLSRRLSRMEDHCGIQCPEEDIFHPPPPPSGYNRCEGFRSSGFLFLASMFKVCVVLKAASDLGVDSYFVVVMAWVLLIVALGYFVHVLDNVIDTIYVYYAIDKDKVEVYKQEVHEFKRGIDHKQTPMELGYLFSSKVPSGKEAQIKNDNPRTYKIECTQPSLAAVLLGAYYGYSPWQVDH
ncbi:hypothetical protein RJ639_007671 [Escallonia herrerae]|uniref:Putative plant transposon protein domain-containing protein n=1 Tax=Escallonia herrerae TaxID=1293975 RepID=A0AA88VXN1_9ASTE|nr:hypothetical protein RJ639_007671 [Escallonia herrerae]